MSRNSAKKRLADSKKKDRENPIRMCECCHRTFLESEMIYDSDPFSDEIYGDTTKHWQCKNCYHESCMDI